MKQRGKTRKRRREPTHDSGYKLLYAHAAMVRDLLRGFVPGDWVQAERQWASTARFADCALQWSPRLERA